jgi:hypothetical protein
MAERMEVGGAPQMSCMGSCILYIAAWQPCQGRVGYVPSSEQPGRPDLAYGSWRRLYRKSAVRRHLTEPVSEA